MLKSRAEIPSVEEQAGYASEICIIAISGISLSVRYLAFFERKLKGGCKIRIILLDPSASSLHTWNLLNKITTAEADIKSGLNVFRALAQMDSSKGKFEIRLSDVFLPYSMFAVDLQKEFGSMVVEFHAYKRTIGERPHIFLTPQNAPKWFDFYRQQFEQAWSDATAWTP
jgi:hypothetical protein